MHSWFFDFLVLLYDRRRNLFASTYLVVFWKVESFLCLKRMTENDIGQNTYLELLLTTFKDICVVRVWWAIVQRWELCSGARSGLVLKQLLKYAVVCTWNSIFEQFFQPEFIERFLWSWQVLFLAWYQLSYFVGKKNALIASFFPSQDLVPSCNFSKYFYDSYYW